MNPLKSMLKWEFTLIYRYKLIHLAILSVVMYYLSLKIMPDIDIAEFHALFLFFDPVLIGIMFVGAMVLFEKTENTLQALTITPMQTYNYFLSKIISLTTLSVIAGLLFIIPSHGIDFNWFNFFSGIILSAVFMILLGFILVSRCNSVNEYLMMMMFSFVALFLPPMFDLFKFYESPIFYLWPSQASFILFGGVFEEVTLTDTVYAVGYLIFWIGLCFYLSKKAYYKYIIMGGK
jgi:fluoroquinolone transport system permease protein